MKLTHETDRQNLSFWVEQIATFAEQEGDRQAVTGVHEAVQQWQSDRFVLAIIGKAKRGKSTLINALLARTDDVVAPVDKLPASSTVSRFAWSEHEQATVFFRDGGTLPIAYSQIREYVTEEHNPANQKHVELVEVFGPFSGLDRDLALVDTPGAGSLHEHHDALLHAFIPQADAVIFLATARMPIDEEERDLLAKLRAADIPKIFFRLVAAGSAARGKSCGGNDNYRRSFGLNGPSPVAGLIGRSGLADPDGRFGDGRDGNGGNCPHCGDCTVLGWHFRLSGLDAFRHGAIAIPVP